MPSAAEFKKAFHLQDGTKLGALGSIHNAKVGHVAVKRNERYEFPATLEIELPKTQKKKITRRQLITALQEHTSGEKIVYSSYGSPYECTVHDVAVTDYSEENIAEMKFLGKAVRRRDIPTLAQQKAEERKEKGGKIEEEQVSQDDIHTWLGDEWRFVKSRFGTSTCNECGNKIDPGVKIAKKKDDPKRGDWLHVACAVAHAQQEHGSVRRSKRYKKEA